MFQVAQLLAGSSPWRTRWRWVCSASSRLAMAAMAACTMGQLSALALVMNTVWFAGRLTHNKARVGAWQPPVCSLSDWHSLALGGLAIASELASSTTGPDGLAPVAALRLGAVYKQSEGIRPKAV